MSSITVVGDWPVIVAGAYREVEVLRVQEWVVALAPWDVFFTGTFRFEVRRVDVASRIAERFFSHNVWRRPVFYAVEWHPRGHGCHVHAVIASSGSCYRRGLWRAWFDRYGRARVEPVRDRDQVGRYCAKYCVKQAFRRGWWNALNCVQGVFPVGQRCSPLQHEHSLGGRLPVRRLGLVDLHGGVVGAHAERDEDV